MKWKLEPKQHTLGSIRTRQKYAWLPTRVNGDDGNKYIIWFEFYWITEKYKTVKTPFGPGCPHMYDADVWVTINKRI